jgi:hypothetical protein
MRVVPGFVLAVMIAHAGAGGQALPEQRTQLVDRRFDCHWSNTHELRPLVSLADA